MRREIAVSIVVVLVAASLGVGYFTGISYRQIITTSTTKNVSVSTSLSSVNSDATIFSSTSNDTTFITRFSFGITLNYTGQWNLAFWGQNGTLTTQDRWVYCDQCYGGEMQYNIYGNATGSGDYQTEITTYGTGYVENTLCVEAAILNAPTGNLKLTVLGTTGVELGNNLAQPVEVCATYAV